MLVQSVQAHRAEPHLLEDLEDNPLVLHLVELLVNQGLAVSSVSAQLPPVHKEDGTSGELEAALDPHHQVLARFMEPEASVMAPWVDLEAPASASEAWEDPTGLAPDQVLDWEAPASAQEVDLHLPARGREQVL